MWSWRAKPPQIAVCGISNFTFLRSIGMAAIRRPNPRLRGTDATFSISRAHRRFLSLPLLGLVADDFDDWLAANGYTRVSRTKSIRMLPHVDAELRRRQVKEVANLTQPVLRRLLGDSPQGVPLLPQEPCGH